MPNSRSSKQSASVRPAQVSRYRLPMAVVATTLAWASAIAPSLALSQQPDEAVQAKQFAPKQFVEKLTDAEQFLDVPSDSSSPSQDAVVPSTDEDAAE